MNATSSYIYEYNKIGVYDISIRGTYPSRGIIDSYNDNLKIIDIKQWGNIKWKNMRNAFYHARGLSSISAKDVPDLSYTIDMSSMFDDARGFNQDISNWDVSNVIDMGEMFDDARIFNQDISQWDVSKVTDMSWMFDKAESMQEEFKPKR